MSSAAAELMPPPRDVNESGAAFKVPLLDRILDGGDPETRQVVLDLGGPSQRLLARLAAARPCRVEIADLIANGGPAALMALDMAEEDPGPEAIHALLPAPQDELLDLVLCWDLPNYLSLSALRRLCRAFGERAASGCRLHMLIAYSRREMPAAPAQYSLRDDGSMMQTCLNGSLCAAPRYSPEDLGNAVGDFRYERGILLANGMQEFVYVWQ